MTKRNNAIVVAFFALQLTGAALFVLILLSASLFCNTKRHPIFFSFCLSWIVFGISYSLLLLSGQAFQNPAPTVCTIQAALCYGAPVLEMFTTLGLVIHLLLNVLSAFSMSPQKHSHPTFLNVLAIIPWVAWTGVVITILAFGFTHEQNVTISPNLTYCVIQKSPIPEVTSVVTTTGLVAVFLVELAIGALLYRNRAIMSKFSQSMDMAIRILIFTVLGVSALSCGVIFAVTQTTRGVQFDLIFAISAALAFGTQRDLLLGLLPQRARPRAAPDATFVTLTSVNFISRSGSIQSPAASRRSSISLSPSLKRSTAPSEGSMYIA